MKTPTKEQIAAEIAALEGCKAYIPHYTKFGADNHATLDLQIEFLKGHIDQTADEWEEMSDDDQSACMEAESWMEGQAEQSPSASWDSYKPKDSK